MSLQTTEPHGEAALRQQIGAARFNADWKNPQHRTRRLLAEFIGTAGLCFVLSAGAAVLALYAGRPLHPFEAAFILSAVSALWLVTAVYAYGDISAHFNPAMTLAFTLRGDMGWPMCGAYIVVQLAAAVAGSMLARAFFGIEGNLAATQPQPGLAWAAAGFELVLTFGMVLMVLSMANGPKLNGPFIPLAVGAYVMSLGTLGAAMNPARAFGPDVARGDLSTWWVYVIGPVAGALLAVVVASVLRGPAKAQEAQAAMGTPLNEG
jgi:glycerol uptake facilitator-like aquaporin